MQRQKFVKESLIFSFIFFTSFSFILSQPLPEIERELKALSMAFLDTLSLSEKLKINKQFTSKLKSCLTRSESFAYPFDSLATVSSLYASDKSFRIFTWQLTERVNDPIPQTLNYFFGLFQRKWIDQAGEEELVIIPLIELSKIPVDIENRILDQNNWLGGLYYPARFGPDIPLLNIKYLDPSTGKKVKTPAYVAMGWNGYDAISNFKFVEVITPDPEVKDRIIFGANIFFYDLVPKYRVVFRYSDNAPFSLNYGYAKWGPGKLFRKRMVIYDHLANPNSNRRPGTPFALGPDGSYDALNFFKRGGYFEWYRNIEIAENYNSKLTQKMLQEQQSRERKRLQSVGLPIEK
ncbi:MAG: hypothetical protein AAGA10_16020 [Bacteroidota bacterium]